MNTIDVRSDGACALNSGRESPGGNDAFTFWKLPEPWRGALNSSVAYSRIIAEWYLLEGYRESAHVDSDLTMRLYYAIKNFIPQKTRHRIRSWLFALRTRQVFPKWPCEDALLEFCIDWVLRSLEIVGSADAWHIAFWPEGKTSCAVLTHDVEGPTGFDRMEAVADLEESYGFRSAWNLPLDQYPIDWTAVEKLRARGFEFGAHGLRHDGMLFRSRKHFLELAPRVESLAREHGLRGFRSPSTLRNPQWISEMDFDFDCSFADSDPYEPQPGGSCSIFPFFLGDVVELPYTLPQDHTLINLLRRDPAPIWIEKMQWIASRGGMILALTHPDYSGSGAPMRGYEELLKRLKDLESCWYALPAQVASWWRRRAGLEMHLCDGRPLIVGSDTRGAVAQRLLTESILDGRGDLWPAF
jgi:peptidoglycan/xylan/chitin deacetylase (PgdA/CDA1 family)